MDKQIQIKDEAVDFHGALSIARQRLDERGIPRGEQDYLLELLNLLVTTIGKRSETEKSPEFVQQLADVFVKNRDILAIIQHQAAELDAFKRISLNLTGSLELSEVLQTVVAEAIRLVKDAQDAHIFLYQDGKLTFGASLDANGQRNVMFSAPRPGGLTYSVALEKKIIVVEDMQKQPLFANKAPADWTGSIISLPLVMAARVVGVMNLARWTAGEFTDSETRLLNLLAEQAAIAISNARLHEAVSHQARSDMLTGLPNRRALDERLEDEVKRSQRTGHPLSVVMMDLDGFKAINDMYGHEVGDQILCQAFSALGQTVRSTDFLARYGGDELTLVLPETDIDPALLVASKLQEKLRSLDIRLPDGQRVALNISGGIAAFPTHGRTATDLLRAADTALYCAKRNQRGSMIKVTGPLKPLK